MATSTRDDAKLIDLREKYEAKHDAAEAILENPDASDAQLTKAEKLIGERDALRAEIENRTADLERADTLRGKAAAGADWLNQPSGRMPFNGKKTAEMGGRSFEYAGSEDAGEAEFGFDEKAMRFRVVSEAGPGTFGEAQWESLKSVQYRRDFNGYLRKGASAIDRSKSLQGGLDDQGGVFAPAELINRVIGRLPAPTRLRGLVNTVTTGRDTLIMPRKQYSADDKYTTAFRASWPGEIPADGTGAQIAVDDTKLTGNVSIPVHTAMLSAAVTKNMLEDAAFSVQAWLENELNQIIDLLYEDMILNGDGIGKPTGILLGAATANDGTSASYPQVVLSGSAAALAYDGLVGLDSALAPQYEDGPNVRYVMNKKSTYAALRKIKDSQNRPLLGMGYGDSGLSGKPNRVLFGTDIVLSQFMPDVGAAAFPIIFGDLMGYYLAQRVGFSIQVLDQTKAKANQIELVGRVRFGGAPIEPFRLKIQKSNDS